VKRCEECAQPRQLDRNIGGIDRVLDEIDLRRRLCASCLQRLPIGKEIGEDDRSGRARRGAQARP